MNALNNERTPDPPPLIDGEPGTARETTDGFRTDEHPHLDRVQNAISGLCTILAGASLVAITVLTVIEVVARGVFDQPLGWNVGFVEQYLMMAMAFFGMVTGYRTGAHVAVSTLYERLPGPARKLAILLGQLAIVFALAWLLGAGVDAAAFSLRTAEQPVPGSAELPWPTSWRQSIMPLAALLGLVVVLIDFYRELISPWRAPSTDHATSEVEMAAGEGDRR